MATRSSYRVIERFTNRLGSLIEKELVLVHVHNDGYPAGHPCEIADWLGSKDLDWNGPGCIAAQLASRLKTRSGGTYIESLDSRGYLDEDYCYDIVVEGPKITFKAYEVPYVDEGEKPEFKEIYSGSPKGFCKKHSHE